MQGPRRARGSSVSEGQGGSSLSSVPESHDGRNGMYDDGGIGSHLHPHKLYLQMWLCLVQYYTKLLKLFFKLYSRPNNKQVAKNLILFKQ